jgi:hypothetical protein
MWIDKLSYMGSDGIVWLQEGVNIWTVLYGIFLFWVTIRLCELIKCLIWEVQVLRCYWNVWIDKLSYMRSVGIVWLLECVIWWTVLYGIILYCVAIGLCELIKSLIWDIPVVCGYWILWIDNLSYMVSAAILWL